MFFHLLRINSIFLLVYPDSNVGCVAICKLLHHKTVSHIISSGSITWKTDKKNLTKKYKDEDHTFHNVPCAVRIE